jgi:hypothetical protein
MRTVLRFLATLTGARRRRYRELQAYHERMAWVRRELELAADVAVAERGRPLRVAIERLQQHQDMFLCLASLPAVMMRHRPRIG